MKKTAVLWLPGVSLAIRIVLRLVLVFTLVDALSPLHAAPLPSFGRYTGRIFYKNLNKYQNAKLDFVVQGKKDDVFYMIAIFTIYFGDFTSQEYITYHFNRVTYNTSSNVLTFSESDTAISLIAESFENEVLHAEMRSDLVGNVGHVVLERKAMAPFSGKIVEPLGGQYIGQCHGVKAVLQLQTMRSVVNAVRLGNPFGAFDIRGSLAQVDPILCPGRREELCVTNEIYNGSYNYFKNHLVLFGRQHTMECFITSPAGMRCGPCHFSKEPPPKAVRATASTAADAPKVAKNRLFSISKGEVVLHLNSEDTSTLDGMYRGYLHHEYQDRYQVASLNIATYPINGAQEPEFALAAIGNLYFGNETSNDVLSYRFDEIRHPYKFSYFVLEKTGFDIDAILEITSFSELTIEGVWYSIFFGRVGEFKLSKEPLKPLPVGFKAFKTISGMYHSADMCLQLGVRLSATPFTSENPFFPLTFNGYFYYLANAANRFQIDGGSYDFYTGMLGLHVINGSRSASGRVDISQPRLDLFWPARGFARRLQPYRQRTFMATNPH